MFFEKRCLINLVPRSNRKLRIDNSAESIFWCPYFNSIFFRLFPITCCKYLVRHGHFRTSLMNQIHQVFYIIPFQPIITINDKDILASCLRKTNISGFTCAAVFLMNYSDTVISRCIIITNGTAIIW